MTENALTIGGASGFWGEAGHATAQLLDVRSLDVLVYDYLAEITLSIMARARMKDPAKGYATDFVTEAMGANLPRIAAQGVKVLSNAGGLNPAACAEALRAEIARQGLDLKVAVVEGDDLRARAAEFESKTEMFSGAAFPKDKVIASINAYLGAFPVAAALREGADIVVTGRCADSALALAACVHRYGWGANDLDELAAGSLAGHLLECGPQSTGGNFTDWRAAGDIADIGYPVAHVEADGAFEITKPEGTAGVVSRLSVGEQMLYEIGDPAAYLLPDVACDFTGVELRETGDDRVRVSGARGRAPSGDLKVSVTYVDGFRGGHVLQFSGTHAREKAEAFVAAGLARARRKLSASGAADFEAATVETFGGRPDGANAAFEEISVKAAVRHQDARAVGVFLKEIIGAALATPPGLHFFTGAGRPKPSPVVRLFSFLVAAGEAPVSVSVDGRDIGFAAPACDAPPSTPFVAPLPAPPNAEGRLARARLEDVAVARSGDKGDAANVGVMARDPRAAPWIWAGLTEEAIRAALPAASGRIERFWLPGSNSMNILAHEALGGGGVASLLNDAQGKAYAQRVLALEIEMPAQLLDEIRGAA